MCEILLFMQDTADGVVIRIYVKIVKQSLCFGLAQAEDFMYGTLVEICSSYISTN